jgi:hypothetical protein
MCKFSSVFVNKQYLIFYRFVENFLNVVTTVVLTFVIVENVRLVQNLENAHAHVGKQVRIVSNNETRVILYNNN